MSGDRAIGLERRDGHDVGRDPRNMTPDELMSLGHVRMSAQQALRLRCIDCSGATAAEVRLCTHVQCPAWPFRMGRSPWRTPPSEAQREWGRRLGARIAATVPKPFGEKALNATAGAAATPVPADGDVAKTHGGAGRGAEDRP